MKFSHNEPQSTCAARLSPRVSPCILAGLFVLILVLPAISPAGPLPGNRWELLTIAYPPGREIEVELGGSDKTLSTVGSFAVKAKKESASLEIEVKGLPSASEAGWAGRQYVLWAFDHEKRVMNLGLVPLRSKSGKWSIEVPSRVFGLLITAEQNPQATVPSSAVALESLLPTDPNTVVPIYREEILLAPQQS